MNVIERLLFQEGYSFLLVCVILIFYFSFHSFRG